jgi:hypothetical protein
MGVVINEVMSNGPTGAPDAIELFNAASGPVDMGGWFLSDSPNNLLKYQIPSGTIIPANSYLVIDERSFNPTPRNPQDSHFALSSTGDSVWLVVADESRHVSRIVDAVEFGASRAGESFARLPNTTGRLFPSDSPSLGRTNPSARRAEVVISEVHFNPGIPSSEAMDMLETLSSADLEYIEVLNASDAAVPLSELRIRGGVDADFTTSYQLQPAQPVVIVSFDPGAPQNARMLAAFRAHFKINADVPIVGKFDGRLGNNYDRITIERDGGSGAFVIVDEVVYDTAPPWPVSLETVKSMRRRSASSYGNAATSWLAENPTPGNVAFIDSLIGDLNKDAVVNAADIDLFCRNIDSGDLAFDLNQDGDVSIADHDFLVRNILGRNYGDANLDGVFNSSDLVSIFQSGGYEDGVENNSGWASGDWNCDGDFTTRDLVAAFQSGRYE